MKRTVFVLGLLLVTLVSFAQGADQQEVQADEWAKKSYTQSKALSAYLSCLKQTTDKQTKSRLVDKTTMLLKSRNILMSKDAVVIDSIIDEVRPLLGKDSQHFLPLLEFRIVKSSNSVGKYQLEFKLFDEAMAVRQANNMQSGREYEQLLRWHVGKLVYRKDMPKQEKVKAYADLWEVYRKNSPGIDSLDLKLLESYSLQCSFAKDYKNRAELLELKKQYAEQKYGKLSNEYLEVLDNLQNNYNSLYDALYTRDCTDMKPEKEKEIALEMELIQLEMSMGRVIESSEINSLLYNLRYYKKDLSAAQQLATRYASYIEQGQGKENELYCKALNLVTETYDDSVKDVIPLLRELLTLQEKVLGKDDNAYKLTQMRLQNALSQNHQMQEVIDMRSSTTGSGDIQGLTTLSSLQAQYGQYREAIVTHERELEYCATHPQAKGTYMFISVLGSVNCYGKLNDLDGLLAYGAKWTDDARFDAGDQLFIFKQVVSSASLPDKASSQVMKFIDDFMLSHPAIMASAVQRSEILEYKATTCLGMKDAAQAERIICQIIASLKQEQADARLVLKYEQYLEICLMAQERFEDASSQNRKVLTMMSGLPGYKNFLEYRSLCCRAVIYSDREDDFDEVLRLCKEIDGFDPQLLVSLSGDASFSFTTFSLMTTILDQSSVEKQRYRAFCKKGMKAEAAEAMKKTVDEKMSLLKFTLSQMDNSMQQNTTTWTQQTNDVLCNTAVLQSDDSLVIKAFDYNLLYKQAFLTAENVMRQQLLGAGNEEVKAKFNEMQNLRTTILQYAKSGLPVKELTERAVQLEKQLVEDSKIYGDFTSGLDLRWTDIRNQLKRGDMVVEFLSYTSFDDNKEHIAALLLRVEWKAPKIVHLFSALQVPDNIYDNVEFSKWCWNPIIPYLDGIKNVYFAPAGLLYNIGIESLLTPDGKGYMSEKYNLFRISSSRELVAHIGEVAKGKGIAAVYGGIDYQTADNEAVAEVPRQYSGTASGSRLREIRGAMSSVDYLPGSKVEAENVAKIFNTAKGATETLLYTGTKATEYSFKAISGKDVKIVHVSTHGFYHKSEDKENDSSLFYLLQQDSEDKALTRSGLLFAGAENILFGDSNYSDIGDGILTAQEISTLDLRTVTLTSLSACQTAQGDIFGDGVFGLQRGFKKAGAQSILMSLWKVDDEATCLLMTEFYKYWIGEKKTKYDALELAKKTVRSHKEKGWNTPKYWAAFILLDGLD